MARFTRDDVRDTLLRVIKMAESDHDADRPQPSGQKLVDILIPTGSLLAGDIRHGDPLKLMRMYSAARWFFAIHTPDTDRPQTEG